MDQLQDAIVAGFGTIFLAICGVVARKIGQYAQSKGAVNLIKQHKELSMLAVKMVEQVYKDFNGEEKKAKSIEMFVDLLGSAGIKLTDKELEAYIESAVKTMKDQVIAGTQEINIK